LFLENNPIDFTNFNKNSLIIREDAKLENNINDNPNERYQFERLGYFIKDSNCSNEKITYNKIVSLKDSWKKINHKD